MKSRSSYPLIALIAASLGLATTQAADMPANIAHLAGKDGAPHLVFVTGDEEYRSEETMPMLARILHRDHGFSVSVCFALTNGVIDPDRLDNIEGLEILEKADMMIVNTRFRKLPDDQAKRITDFAETGKPMAGFRTATHAFKYGGGNPLDKEWPQKVFGLPWIKHHGHDSSTDAGLSEANAAHPVLRGVKPFHARSWLYHSTTLLESATPLIIGRAVKGKKPGGEHFSEPYACAWTHEYKGEKGISRVFFTTMGHPEDFQQESMRKLSLNGILWALGREKDIPADGSKADFAAPYEPAESGFGGKFKKGLKPADMLK
jgi:type 1 glutamine amidotransferase